MTEAIGQAGMIEAPVVIIEVQRGGPSTGIPTKTEQADLNQVFGASQGDYPRVIIAPTDTTDCYYSAVEAHNLAEKYQLPVTIISDLLLSEHPETIEADALRHDVPIERGEIVSDWSPEKGQFKRYAFTRSGVSPRALPGTEGAMYVAATDDHDEEGVVISDVFTNPPVRRKIQEKRMRKLDKVLQELAPPSLEGPPDAEQEGTGTAQDFCQREARRVEAEGGGRNQPSGVPAVSPAVQEISGGQRPWSGASESWAAVQSGVQASSQASGAGAVPGALSGLWTDAAGGARPERPG